MSNSLIHVDLKALSQPATKLIECVSKGIGALYKPHGIVREAKSTAEANLILASGDIEKARLQRAADRMLFLEDRRQAIIESVVEQSLKELPEIASTEPVSEDWTVQFFENCKDVGDTEMQKLWAKILAGEVTKPGSCSRRTMQTLKSFDRYDAEAFTNFCSICVFEGVRFGAHLAFNCEATAGALPGPLSWHDMVLHLASIGIIAPEDVFQPCEDLVVEFFGSSYRVGTMRGLEPGIQMCVRLLTAVGEQLFRIVEPVPSSQLIGKIASYMQGFNLEMILLQPHV